MTSPVRPINAFYEVQFLFMVYLTSLFVARIKVVSKGGVIVMN